MIGFIGVLLGMFAIGVMQLVLAAALPSIVAEIGGSNLYSLVFSSYMLASLATIPIFSKLADIYGKKKFYILGVAFFAAGTLYGGLATSMTQLIAARVIQGFSAGIITPVSLALISDSFSSEKRGRMIGVFGFVQLLSNLLSPPLGGFITKHLGWHWIFYITFILILFSMLFVSLGTKHSKPSIIVKFSEIDISGGLLFGGFSVLTVFFFNVISKYRKLETIGLLLILGSTLIGVLLILNEKRHKNPVIKIEFFKNKIIRRAIASSIIAGAIMYGLITILPICADVLGRQGFKTSESLMLFLFMAGVTVGMIGSSRLTAKFNSGSFIKALWTIMSICSLLILYFLARGNLVVFNILDGIIGLCVGGVMAAFLINSQNTINSEDRTVLSGLIQLGRYLGASIGVTVLASVMPVAFNTSGIAQFSGAFTLLAAMCVAGIVNEIL